MSDASYLGFEELPDAATAFNRQAFQIARLMSGQFTAELVQVKAVRQGGGGAVAVAGVVDVQIMVHQIDGQGQPTPHGIIYGVPYNRIQGGANAIILDPQVNDIGVAIFCRRDISKVVATQAPALPGSRRQMDPADALYLGGFLNGTPTQYLQFSTAGITAISPTAILLQAPTTTVQGKLVVTDTTHLEGAMTADSTIVATGDVTGAGTSLHTHEHSGVTTGGGTSGPPV